MLALLLTAALSFADIPDRLRVSFVPEIFPNSYRDAEGNRTGLFIDLIEEFCRIHAIEITYVDGSFPENYNRAIDGEIDILIAVAYIEERRAVLDYVEESVFSTWTQVVAHRQKVYEAALDLDGARLAVLEGDQNADAFRQFATRLGIQVELLPFSSYGAVLSTVNAGQVDGAVIYNALRISAYPNVARTDIILNSRAGSFAAAKGNHPEVIALLEAQLARWKSDPYSFYYQTLTRHYGIATAPDPYVPEWLLVAAVVLVIAAIASLTVIRSLTRRLRRANAELRDLNNSLENKVARRTSELRESQARLVRAEKLASLSRMLSGMAHELNTPLGVARTAASFLTSELRELLRESSRAAPLSASQAATFLESSQIVEHNVERAVRLVRSVRDVLSDQLLNNRTDVNLREYVSLSWASIGARLDAAGLSYDVAAPDVNVRLNPHILDEIFAILAGNTLSHAYPGGEPGHVQTTVTVVNQQLEIDYRDTGIGIPPSRRQLVFEPFQTTKREEGRIGIGLYTLSLLVDRFDGSASIAPMDGPGTRFLITLKLDDAEASPQRQPEQSDSN